MKAGKQYHYSRQDIDQADMDAVLDVLNTDFLSQGPRLAAFEADLADYLGVAHCLAVSNGTTALTLALQAMGIGKGHTGATSALTFVASANAVRHCGADVRFTDISPDTWNMSPDSLEALCKSRPIDVVIPVHFAGLSCDMDRLSKLAAKYGFQILEDACQALGGSHDGHPIGSCRHSRAAAFSFHPTKSITTGEGGVIATNDRQVYERARSLRQHGMKRTPPEALTPWCNVMDTEGYNCKITEMQCALGASQLVRLDALVAKRRALAARYRTRLESYPVAMQHGGDDDHARHLLPLLIDFDSTPLTKLEFHSAMQAKGIHLYHHYLPVPLHPFYRALGHDAGECPHACRYSDRAFSYPLHPGLEIDDVDHICDTMINLLWKDSGQ